MRPAELIDAYKAGRMSTTELKERLRVLVLQATRTPLSEGQRGLWMLQKLAPDMSAYNVPVCLRLGRALNAEELQEACAFLLEQFPILTSMIEVEHGVPLVVSRPSSSPCFQVETLSPRLEPHEVLDHLQHLAKAPFALEHDPGARARRRGTRKLRGAAAIVRESELLARNIADGWKIAMAQQAYGEMGPLLARRSGAQYPRIQWVVIGTETGETVAATPRAPRVDFADFPRRRGAAVPRLRPRCRAPSGRARSTRLGVRHDDPPRTIAWSASSGMGVSTAELEQELEERAGGRRAPRRGLAQTVWLVSLVVLAIGIVLAALQGVRLARPIKALTIQAERIAQGNLDRRVPEDRRATSSACSRTRST